MVKILSELSRWRKQAKTPSIVFDIPSLNKIHFARKKKAFSFIQKLRKKKIPLSKIATNDWDDVVQPAVFVCSKLFSRFGKRELKRALTAQERC